MRDTEKERLEEELTEEMGEPIKKGRKPEINMDEHFALLLQNMKTLMNENSKKLEKTIEDMINHDNS